MILLAKARAERLPLADRSVALCLGSPPYTDARLYLEDGVNLGISMKPVEWVDWMLRVTAECLRVTNGPVIWVASGVTRKRTYWPSCEGLMWRWWSEGWGERGQGTHKEGSAYRPCFWKRSSIPGSGGDQWYRADVEYVMTFKRPGPLPYAEPTANGRPPKWAPGGDPSHRKANGNRVGKSRTDRLADGSMRAQTYVPPILANHGNLLDVKVGGGRLGHSLAHENEAPFPTSIPRFFIKSHSRRGDIIIDPFSGSGSTGQAAGEIGRDYIGFDMRMSQCELGKRRLRDIQRELILEEKIEDVTSIAV